MKESMKPREIVLPKWAEEQDANAWTDWINNRAKSCYSRAKSAQKKKAKNEPPTTPEWRAAVVNALSKNSRFHYSKFPIQIKNIGSNSPWYPSIDHVDGLFSTHLAIESRIVNDMKSILSPDEFKTLIGHLAATLGSKKMKLEEAPAIKRVF